MIIAVLTGEANSWSSAEYNLVDYNVEATDFDAGAPSDDFWVTLHVSDAGRDPFSVLDTLFKGRTVRVTVEVLE